MPDYTIGIAERIASLPDSFATSNSINRNYFQETNQSVINKVTVALAPDTPTALDPNPDTPFASSTDGDSVDTYGQQDGPLFITLLATIEEAGELSQYLLRADPAFWFSNLAISLNTLSEENKNIVANLEIGQQIAVTKTFPAGVVPQSVTEYLFVEGISHRVTPETHVVTIYTGPATTYLQWTLSNYLITTTRTNLVLNPNFETNSLFSSPVTSLTIARSTTESYIGSASLAGTKTVSTGIMVFGTSTTTNRIPVEVGQTFTCSLYVKSSSVSRSAWVRVYFFNAAGLALLSADGPASFTSTTAWQRRSIVTTIPATTVTVAVSVFINAVPVGEVHYIDAILMETGSTLLPYFDGTYAEPYTNYSLITQTWSGTANGSTSTGVWGLNSSLTGSPLNDSTYGLA